LTRQEKERLVINLYNQGKTIREISKEVRISFRRHWSHSEKRVRRRTK
jgi:hypothetical protein